MGLLDIFLGGATSGASPAPDPAIPADASLVQRYLLAPTGVSSGTSDTINSALGAIGKSLLTSDNRNPLGNVPYFMEQEQKSVDQKRQRAALKMILKQANPGLSDAQLNAMASDPAAAKLAMQLAETQAGTAAGLQASGILGGILGGASGTSGMPGVTPAAPGGPAAGVSLNGSTGGEIEKKFADTLQAGGLTNPYGLGAVAAYAQHESRYSPKNITGSWSDPSESGQPGTSGGILSWRGDRLANMQAATRGAEDPVVAQAQFLLKEDPALTQALQNAQSADEAHRLMADAWKFAGYDRPGGENAARLASTRAYSNRFLQGINPPVQVADASGGLGAVSPAERTPLPPPRGARGNVVTAMNEREVQAQESRAGMYPPSVYGVTADAQAPQIPGGAPRGPAASTEVAGNQIPLPSGGTATYRSTPSGQADLPAPGAREAAFQIPPGQGDASPPQYGPVTQRALAARAAASNGTAAPAPSFALNDPAQAARAIPQLMRVLQIPNLPDAQKTQSKTMLDYALGVVKPTDRTRQLMEAGYTPGTEEYRTAYRNLVNGDRTPLGYRLTQDGQGLEAIPGGPADPSNKSAQKPPAGFRVSADGQSFEFVPGGPADPATISDRARAQAAGKPAATPKPLPHNAVKDLSEAGASFGDYNRFVSEFRDGYGGWRNATVGDAANSLARYTGIGNRDAADWWSDYAAKRNVVRNKLFGAALTAQEKTEFEKADITPGMTPDAIRRNLARQQEAATKAARKMSNYYIKAGRNPEEIEAALGVGLDELGLSADGASAQQPQRNSAPTFAPSDLVAEARRRGLIR